MEKFWDANHEKLRQMQKVVKMLEGVDTSQGGRMIPEDQRPAVSSLSPIYIFTTLYPSYYHYYLSFYLAFLSNALFFPYQLNRYKKIYDTDLFSCER